MNATRLARLVAVAAAAIVGVSPASAEPAQPVRSTRGAVAADDARASRIGADVLAEGGNAVDAAVATALALGVVNPASSGIGGGGFALVWDAAAETLHVYDFREVAPAALDPSDFVGPGGIDPARSRQGGLAVGVPGEVRGLALLSRKHGRLSWRRLVAPSAHLARDGAAVSEFFAHAAASVRKAQQAVFDPRMEGLLGDGAGRTAGTMLSRAALARTLLVIAGDPDAFYRGPLADELIATVREAGGVMTAADLAAYAPVERDALRGRWNGLSLATMPMPSSGGVVLLEALGILERSPFELRALGAGTAPTLHLVAEALKHGFADRARLLGDTASGHAAAATLLDDARLRRLAAKLRLDRTQPPEAYGETPPPAPASAPGAPKPGGTSHLCVVDGEGNAVALTTTVNGYFGAKVVTRGGVVLNNQIDDFTIDPAEVNMFGLTQSEANLVGPGKRPLSSMTPLLVFDASGERVVGCAGGSGGPRIISHTVAAVLGAWLFDQDAHTAIASPRVHHQWSPDRISADVSLAPDVRAGLTKRGHVVVDQTSPTAVQIIKVLPDGVIEAASDPRKGGLPAAP